MNVIATKKISQKFGYLNIFCDVDFSMSEGECALIQGNNGIGKTTFLKTLAGIYTPTSGEILYYGLPFSVSLKKYKSESFFFSHEISLYDDLSLQENIMFFSTLYKKKIDKTTDSILTLLKLNSYSHVKLKKLSFGTKKKVNLCLIYLFQPKILYLDEPYSGLDTQTVDILNQLIKNILLNKGCVIIVSHQTSTCHQLISKNYCLKNKQLLHIQ